jgi:hypothetical protein
MAWWHRDRRRGALAWGVLGTCLGQIHVSGFLFAAALAGTTVLAGTRRVRWGWWLAGGVAGSVAMVPWFVYLAGDRAPVHHNCFAFHRWIEGKFWGHWATEPLCLDLRGIVGEDHPALLRWPLLDGHPTYGVAGLQVLAAVLGATILAVALLRWWRRDRLAAAAPLSETALLVRAGFLGYGLLLTLAAVRFYRHYMLVTFPLSALWLARLALPEAARRGRAFGRSLLLGLCVVGALVSAVTLSFLHERGGTRVGPFGRTYQQQVRETGQRPPPVDVPED